MGLVTFNEEFQFARRLRVRKDLRPKLYGYIEKGMVTLAQRELSLFYLIKFVAIERALSILRTNL